MCKKCEKKKNWKSAKPQTRFSAVSRTQPDSIFQYMILIVCSAVGSLGKIQNDANPSLIVVKAYDTMNVGAAAVWKLCGIKFHRLRSSSFKSWSI